MRTPTPTPMDQLVPTAFDSTLDVFGGAYTAPEKGFRVLDLGNGATHPTISLKLSDAGHHVRAYAERRQ